MDTEIFTTQTHPKKPKRFVSFQLQKRGASFICPKMKIIQILSFKSVTELYYLNHKDTVRCKFWTKVTIQWLA